MGYGTGASSVVEGGPRDALGKDRLNQALYIFGLIVSRYHNNAVVPCIGDGW